MRERQSETIIDCIHLDWLLIYCTPVKMSFASAVKMVLLSGNLDGIVLDPMTWR